MFEELDDPAGVPHDPRRMERIGRLASRIRLRRRVATAAGVVVVVALPLGGLIATQDRGEGAEEIEMMTSPADDRPDRQPTTTIAETPPATDDTVVSPSTTSPSEAVRTAPPDRQPSLVSPTTAPEAAVTPPEQPAVADPPVTPTPTTAAPPSTSVPVPEAQPGELVSSIRPTGNTGSLATTTGWVRLRRSTDTAWDVELRVQGLAAASQHQVNLQMRHADGTLRSDALPIVCTFTTDGAGAGGCTATVTADIPGMVGIGAPSGTVVAAASF